MNYPEKVNLLHCFQLFAVREPLNLSSAIIIFIGLSVVGVRLKGEFILLPPSVEFKPTSSSEEFCK